jgi:hypothetical protein
MRGVYTSAAQLSRDTSAFNYHKHLFGNCERSPYKGDRDWQEAFMLLGRTTPIRKVMSSKSAIQTV